MKICKNIFELNMSNRELAMFGCYEIFARFIFFRTTFAASQWSTRARAYRGKVRGSVNVPSVKNKCSSDVSCFTHGIVLPFHAFVALPMYDSSSCMPFSISRECNSSMQSIFNATQMISLIAARSAAERHATRIVQKCYETNRRVENRKNGHLHLGTPYATQ